MNNKHLFMPTPLTLFISVLLISVNSFASDDQQHLSGGETTVKRHHASAYSAHSNNLKDVKGILKFNGGNKFFEEPWAQSAGSVSSQDGLGPLFNNNACQDCHIRDGRGHASKASDNEQGHDFSTLLIRARPSCKKVAFESTVCARPIPHKGGVRHSLA